MTTCCCAKEFLLSHLPYFKGKCGENVMGWRGHMYDADLDVTLCRRISASRGRGAAIEDGLIEEYFACFSKRHLTDKQRNVLLRCMDLSVMLAHSTIIPVVCRETTCAVKELHPLARAVCVSFFKHLSQSWFALDNPELHVIYEELKRRK